MRWSTQGHPRQNPKGDVRAHRDASNTTWFTLNWCTGKDSNLRTSLGGTDLQSVGFNHSPTCAKTPILRPTLARNQARIRARRQGTARPADTNRRTVSVRRNGSANRHLEVLYGVLLEKIYAATAPRNVLRFRKLLSGAGEGI